jgi:hypothetical protein
MVERLARDVPEPTLGRPVWGAGIVIGRVLWDVSAGAPYRPAPFP